MAIDFSTYSLIYTTFSAYSGGVIDAQGNTHFVPYNAKKGQKVSESGVVSTYSLAVTTATSAYSGGVLNGIGDIYFVNYNASIGQKINAAGVVSSFALAYTCVEAYSGGVLLDDGCVHFIPCSAEVGQKIDSAGVVSTYSLAFTIGYAYFSGASFPDGDTHFAPFSSPVGQKITRAGVVSTYEKLSTGVMAYRGAVYFPDTDEIHFIPCNSPIGQKVTRAGVVSTYSLAYTTTFNFNIDTGYYGGVYRDNSIYFIPRLAPVWQSVNVSGVVSTHSVTWTTTLAFYGAVFSAAGRTELVPYNSSVGHMLEKPYTGKNITDINFYSYALPFTHVNAFCGGVLGDAGTLVQVPNYTEVRGQYNRNTGVVSTHSLVHTGLFPKYCGGVVDTAGGIHFIPCSAKVGSYFTESTKAISTYSLTYTAGYAYWGGVLHSNNYIYFVPYSATRGQRVTASKVTSTFALVYTTAAAYRGAGILADGSLHFVPYNATVGQKIDSAGIVSTYALSITGAGMFSGGVLDQSGNLHFIPFNSGKGQKISASGVVSTYELAYACPEAYMDGTLDPVTNRIYFIPHKAPVGQCIDSDGIVSTFALPYTIGADALYAGGVLDFGGNTVFTPYNATVGYGISRGYAGNTITNISVSTVSLVNTEGFNSSYDGGVLFQNGAIHLAPAYHSTLVPVGQKINTLTKEVSTYSLIYTEGNYKTLFSGGTLDVDGTGVFAPVQSKVGERLIPSGTVTTFPLMSTFSNGYDGAVLSQSGEIHYVPYSATIGQKISKLGVVSTYSVLGLSGYSDGVLDGMGNLHFIPNIATKGLKISPSGVVSTYSILSGGYFGAVRTRSGEIHFVPYNAPVGQKISTLGVVSTYALAHVIGDAYKGGVLDKEGNIHFVPYNATVGQMIDTEGIVSTYALLGTVRSSRGGLSRSGEIWFFPTGQEAYAQYLTVDYSGTIVTEDPADLIAYQDLSSNKLALYITITLDGVEYDITEYVMGTPLIDRQKSILPESIASLSNTDAVFSVSNNTKYFSPLNTNSIFYGKNYIGAELNIYSGYVFSDTLSKVINQLKVYLKEINLESKTSTAKLVCLGNSSRLKNVMVGPTLSTGTANPKVYTGTWTFKNIVEDLLVTYAGFSYLEFDISDIDMSFEDASFDNVTVESAIGSLCQAASCEIYEGRNAKLIVKAFSPLWGSIAGTELKASTNILQATSVYSNDDLIFSITVTGDTGVYADGGEPLNVTGRIIDITNAYLQTNSEAEGVVNNYMERFGTMPLIIELDIDYMPALDLGDIVFVTEEESDLVNKEFEIYRITLDIENLVGKVYLVQSYYTAAYLFYNSDSTPAYADSTSFESNFGFYGDRDNPESIPPYKLL
jgi:hypothetical protein